MNQKNSLGIDLCFKDLDNPIDLFVDWFNEAKKTEINDPNALSLATADKSGIPSVRMVLLKNFNNNGFIFYTNFNSKKSVDLKENPNASLCFHWKSLLRQIRITGKISKVSDKDADLYYKSRSYGSRIGAWASKQSSICMSFSVIFIPGGQPSTIHPMAGPWDSPQVVKRNIFPKVLNDIKYII